MENKDNVNVQTEKKKVRKIGRLTFGITLILVGLSVVIQTFLPIEIFRYILMLWPLVFISIGIEVIYFSKREEIKYDGVGIFLIFVVLFFGTIFGAVNYGVNKVLYNDNMKDYIAEELNDSVLNYTLAQKIKINNYLKIGGISEEDKQRLEQLESSMNIVANENGLQKLASQLSTKISERYDIESEQSETQQDEQNSIKDRLEAYRGAIDAEVQALKIGKISKAKRCQKRANMLIQQLEKDDIQRAVEYKRGVLAGLNVSLDISTEKVQVWLNRFKGCWREEDFNKRKTITQEITNITQTKTEEKSTKELFAGVEI